MLLVRYDRLLIAAGHVAGRAEPGWGSYVAASQARGRVG